MVDLSASQKSPLRIAHVLEALEGGVSLHVRTLAEQQVKAGHAVEIVAPAERTWGKTDTELAPRMRELGVPVTAIAMRRVPPHPVNAVAMARLWAQLRRFRPDVAHTHSTAAGLVGRPVARALRIPTVHTPNGIPFSNDATTAAARVALVLERALSHATTFVIAVSESEAIALRRAYDEYKVVVVPNGIDAGGAPPPLPQRFRVVAVNRLTYQKDPEMLVRVMSEFLQREPGAEAVIVGYGELEETTRTQIAQAGAPIPIVDASGADAIAGASALLLGSRFEGAPYVVLEAMRAGRPTIATDVVGSRDLVDDAVTGFLFPRSAPDVGVDALVRLARDPDLLRRMGVAARARFEAEFTIDVMADGVEALYRRAVASRRR